MKHYLCPLAVFFAVVVFSCSSGEVGDHGYDKSSGSGDFKTYCGEKPYETSTSFCFEEKIYPLCIGDGDGKYNPNEQGCLNGTISPKCGEKLYDNTIKFCSGDSIYSKCEGKQYTPETEFCFGDVKYSKCNSNSYNPNKEFCGEDNEIHPLCDLKYKYNVETQICFFNRVESKCSPSKYTDEYCDANGISYRICGNIEYESAKKFCNNNEIYQRCGVDLKEYDPYKEFCHSDDGSVYLRCNGNMYNPGNYFCFDNKIYSKCGTETYNPKESFCYENVLDTLCNGVEFNPKNSFCSHEDYKVYSRCNGGKYNTKQKICSKENSTETLYDICPSGNFANGLSNCCSASNPNCTEYQICGDAKEKYNIKTEFCDGKAVYPLCGGKPYDNPSNKFCWPNYSAAGGQAIDKCRVQTGVSDFGQPIYSYFTYDYDMQYCSSDGIKDRNLPPICPTGMTCCFGTPYDAGSYFCDNEKLYPKCGGGIYNPNTEGCFGGEKYRKCSLTDVVGPCVDNTLRRCRQYGSGPNQTIDPLPGVTWTCQADGKIEGTIKNETKPDGSAYKIVQIGNQVWLAEDLAVGLDDWATSMDVPSNFNTERYSFPSNVPWKGPCPDGFYVPSDEDWKKLVDYAGGADLAGNRLKSKSGWLNGGDGLDSYGFNALPKGYENNIVGPTDVGSRAMWWSLTQPLSNNVRNASYWTIISADSEVRNHNQDKALFKAYVRCLYY